MPPTFDPPPPSFIQDGRQYFSLRKATVNRSLGAAQGRNLNCSATRKRSRPVDGRRPQTFAPPGRLLGSAAQDLLAQPASLGDEPVACRPRHRAKPPALLRPGTGQSGA